VTEREGPELDYLNSGGSALHLNPGQGHCIVFLGKTLFLIVPLSTQVHKWVQANLLLGAGVTLQWTSIPSWGRYV